MGENEQKPTDILGIAPYGEAIKTTVEKGFEGAQALLSRICLPVAGELGLLLQDKLRHWRLKNIIKILNKSEGLIDFKNDKLILSAHPRVVNEIIENGSWCDDEELQNMWAGLIATSCNEKLGDDSNLLFVNTLKNLTSRQAKILNYICENCTLKIDTNDLVFANHLELGVDELKKIVDFESIHEIDVELDYLRSNELIMMDSPAHGAGLIFGQDSIVAHLEPSPFALALFVKSKGFNGSTNDYFKIKN